MHVGVLGRELDGQGGTHTYLANVLRHLPDVDETVDWSVCVPDSTDCPHSESASVTRRPYPAANPVVDDHVSVPLLLHRCRPDVTWFPKGVVPHGTPGASVVTVHDMGYFVDSDYYPLVDRLYMRYMLKSSCERADEIIAVSESTKRDVLRYTRTDPERVHVVHHGVASRFWEDRSRRERAAFRRKYRLPEDGPVIYGGNTGRRKNLEATVAAFERSNVGPAKLVFTGNSPEYVREHVRDRGDVVNLGYIPDGELPLLYQTSSVFVYMSEYEGFGLPVLEAMASRVPVVTSTKSSLPEVAGDAAVYADPKSVGGISRAMEDALDWSAAERRRRVEKGVERASEFTWERTARRTLDVLREAVRP